MRYDRQTCLPELGLHGQKRLREASVAVVGAGGLGCPVLQYLAAAGVGRLAIIDDDSVEESNLHRQVLYGTSSLGQKKVAAAAEALANLNPEVKTEQYPCRATQDIVRGYDFVIDCSDNLETRYLLDDCGRPWIYGAVHRYEGQVAVFHYRGSAGYRDLFPERPPTAIPDCAQTGVLGVLPGITGMLQATECIKLITGIGEPLVGQLLVFNLLTQEFRRYQLGTSSAVVPREAHPLSLQQFRQSGERYFLVDVREVDEEPEIRGALRVPLSELSGRLAELPTDREVAFACSSGQRARQAALLVASKLMRRVYAINEPLY